MATTITATRQLVEDYQRLFVNRRAYTIQSVRPHPKQGGTTTSGQQTRNRCAANAHG
jgi:hypothetical protein